MLHAPDYPEEESRSHPGLKTLALLVSESWRPTDRTVNCRFPFSVTPCRSASNSISDSSSTLSTHRLETHKENSLQKKF